MSHLLLNLDICETCVISCEIHFFCLVSIMLHFKMPYKKIFRLWSQVRRGRCFRSKVMFRRDGRESFARIQPDLMILTGDPVQSLAGCTSNVLERAASFSPSCLIPSLLMYYGLSIVPTGFLASSLCLGFRCRLCDLQQATIMQLDPALFYVGLQDFILDPKITLNKPNLVLSESFL